MLVYQHFGAHVPGCGPESACASLERTVWGKVPGLGWPVSFLGLAYFAGLLVAWIAARGRWAASMRLVSGVGAAVSLLFLVVMIILGKLCPYCTIAHLANLVFVWIVYRRRDRETIPRSAIPAAAAFAIVTIALAVGESSHRSGLAAQAERERTESRDAILAQTQTPESEEPVVQPVPAPIPEPAAPLDTAAAGPEPSRSAGQGGLETEPAPAEQAGFTGRYLQGPEKAAIRIVMLTDYQCPDCRRIENEIEAILEQRGDVSLSTKHFPMCKEAAPGVPCNRYATMNLHPNACNAARAAEAAGILGGAETFWSMHRWLFDREGKFDQAQLMEQVRSLGLDPPAFTAAMTGAESLKRVHDDVEEGFALGLHYTPMIFVNAVEFRGWQTPGALARTIAEVAATNPPPRTAAADHPPVAERKLIEDWLAQPIQGIPASAQPHSLGGAAGSEIEAEIVLFGDYEEPNTANVDAAIRAFVAKHPSSRYTFRHFPIFSECNPTLPPNVRKEAIHPNACAMARAAEAAGRIGGEEAFWRMHAWLMSNQAGFTTAALEAAAGGMGIDPARLITEMQSPEVTAAIAADARAAQSIRLTAVPWVFVDHRYVPRTSRAGKVVVEGILEEAMKR